MSYKCNIYWVSIKLIIFESTTTLQPTSLMKALKYILFLLLIAIIGLAIYVAVQPNSFEITKSKTIEGPSAVIFDIVSDTSTIDRSSFWKENETLKSISKNPNDSITLIFSSKAIPKSKLIWYFHPEGNGSTKVMRKLVADNLSFMSKAKAVLFRGKKKEIAEQLERSLKLLDANVTESLKFFDIKVNGITEHGGGFYMYKTTASTASNISNMMDRQYAQIINFMEDNSISTDGMPFTIYNEMNENGSVIMSNAIPVQNMVTVAEESTVLCGYMERARVLKTTLKGNYTNLEVAWKAAFKYLKDNGLEQSEAKPFEIYTNDPDDVPNPANWITELYIPLKTPEPVATETL